MFGEKNAQKVFLEHYKKMCQIVKRMSFSKDPEFELLSAILMVTCLARSDSGNPDDQIDKPITKEIDARVSKDRFRLFCYRLETYKAIVLGEEELMCYWSVNGVESIYESDDVLKCVAALGDVLYDSALAYNKKNGGITIRGIDVAIEFTKEIIIPLSSEFTTYYTDLLRLWLK